MYLKCARNQQQKVPETENMVKSTPTDTVGRTGWRHVDAGGPYGHTYANGNAVGVRLLPDAPNQHTWTPRPTTLPSAYRWSRRRRSTAVLWVPQRLRRRRRIRRRLFTYADSVLRRRHYADGGRRRNTTPTAIVATPTADRRRRFDGFP